jgi:hypothetical protein
VPSARYVDDIYIFVESVDATDRLLRELIPALGSYDLVLNEAKSVVIPKSALITGSPIWKRCSVMPSLRLPAKSMMKILTPITDFNRSGTTRKLTKRTLELKATTVGHTVAVICWRTASAPILRLIRFEHCLVVFVAAHPESDRLILAPEAVVTTAAAQSCADRERLKCQRSHDAEGQHRPPGKAITFPLPDQQQPLH